MSGFEPIADIVSDVVNALRSHPGYEAATLFLGGVFAWSGAAKIRRPTLAAMAIADFGLVINPRGWHGVVIGTLELGLALALIIGQGMPVVLTLTCGLLAVFTLLVAVALRRRQSFACFCFGGEEELSRATLIRNLLLVALSTLLLSAALVSADRLGDPKMLLLTAMLAITALAMTALLTRLPKLLRWNSEVRDHFEERARACAQ